MMAPMGGGGAPRFVDTCRFQFLLSGFEVNGRQQAVDFETRQQKLKLQGVSQTGAIHTQELALWANPARFTRSGWVAKHRSRSE
jgi:hypothetical protein